MSRSVVAAIGVALSIVLAGCGGGAVSAWTFAPRVAEAGVGAPDSDTSTDAIAVATVAASSAPASPRERAAWPPWRPRRRRSPSRRPSSWARSRSTASTSGFEPSAPTVAAPGTYLVRLVNDGAIFHDLTFDDGTVIGADPGQTAEGRRGRSRLPGSPSCCSVPGPWPGGHVGRDHGGGRRRRARSITGGERRAADSHGGPMPMTDVAADPNAPPPVTYDATAPAPPGGRRSTTSTSS